MGFFDTKLTPLLCLRGMIVFGTNVHLSLTISHLAKNKLEEKVLVTKTKTNQEKKTPSHSSCGYCFNSSLSYSANIDLSVVDLHIGEWFWKIPQT